MDCSTENDHAEEENPLQPSTAGRRSKTSHDFAYPPWFSSRRSMVLAHHAGPSEKQNHVVYPPVGSDRPDAKNSRYSPARLYLFLNSLLSPFYRPLGEWASLDDLSDTCREKLISFSTSPRCAARNCKAFTFLLVPARQNSADTAGLMPSWWSSGQPLRLAPMPRKLAHYLRNERRRNALTQADIAALLDVRWKQRVGWYERGKLPPIETALALEAILGKPISELLAGAYERIAFNVRRRAQELLARDLGRESPRRIRRKRSLTRIAA